MRRYQFLASAALVTLAALGAVHCSSSSSAEEGEEEGAIGEGIFKPYVTPDPNNPWTKSADLASYDLGQENVLPDEDARFSNLVTRVRALQDQLAAKRNDGKTLRTFHAKSHACLSGELRLTPHASIPAAGIFSPENARAAHPTTVRLSNGVGWNQGDSKIDVRGVAFKIAGLVGATLPGAAAGEQDLLFTNGPITPAPQAEHFVEFMEVSAKAELESHGGAFATLTALFKSAPYLLSSKNERVRRNLEFHMAPSVLKKGSLYGEQFWSGGAIALGTRDGDPVRAAAVDAVKLNVLTGAPHKKADGTVTCTPYSKMPNPLDADYFRKDIVQRLKDEGLCFELRAQLQRDARRQPIEDTSVEWQEKDSPSLAVGMVLVPPTDLTTPEAQAAEAACNEKAFTPWNGLAAHRPLGNIMRIRRLVYDTSAKARLPK